MMVVKPEWVWTPSGWLTDHCVRIASRRIVEVAPSERYPQPDLALPGRLLMPGLVNAHSHAFQRAFRGHVQHRPSGRDDFWSWRDRMYSVANELNPDEVEAITALAYLEMLEAGVTRVGEFHYLQHAPDGSRYDDPDELSWRVVAAAADVGIDLTLLRVAYGRAGAGAELRADQRRFGDRSPDDVLAAVQRLRARAPEGVVVGVAPHSVRAVERSWLRLIGEAGGPLHAHVSEQPAENRACLQEHGLSPLAVFAEEGLLEERFCAVHLTHPMEGDLDRLVSAGASVCVCPSTELDLGDGFLPLEARRRARLCLGSDSHARIDLLDEASTLEMHGRALAGQRNVMTPEGKLHGLAERLLWAATGEGSLALGAPRRGVVVGEIADLVAIDLRRPAALGVPPLEAAALLANAGWVDHVWVGGAVRVAGGRHVARDRVVARAAKVMSRLFSERSVSE